MGSAFGAMAFAALGLFLTKIPVSVAQGQLGYPRDQQSKLRGWGKRALGAHLNAFESFPPFAASVFVAVVTKQNPSTVSTYAWLYILARIIYTYLYIANWDKLRTLSWIMASLCTGRLFLLPWIGPKR